MFGSLATICISFIWTSGIFLCLVILDNLCNLKCFPQHGAVTRPWLGSLRARCSFKKKKIENPNQNKKPSAVYSLQFNVWPHSPESLSFGSLVLNMLPKTTQAFFFPPLKHTFHFVHPHSQASLKLLLSRCPPYVYDWACRFQKWLLHHSLQVVCPVPRYPLCVSLFSCTGVQDWSMQQEEQTSVLFVPLLQVTNHYMPASFWSHLSLVQFFPLEYPHCLELAQLLTSRFPWYSSQHVSGTLM